MGTLPPGKQGGLPSMNLHELITLMIHPIGTSGTNEIQYMKYTSEYILKLQIHQQQSMHNHHHGMEHHHRVQGIIKTSSTS